MDKVLIGVGELTHTAWRRFFSEQRSHDPISLSTLSLGSGGGGTPGFIDGDFVELLLDMSGPQQELVVQEMSKVGGEGSKTTLSKLLSVIEGLAALH